MGKLVSLNYDGAQNVLIRSRGLTLKKVKLPTITLASGNLLLVNFICMRQIRRAGRIFDEFCRFACCLE